MAYTLVVWRHVEPHYERMVFPRDCGLTFWLAILLVMKYLNERCEATLLHERPGSEKAKQHNLGLTDSSTEYQRTTLAQSWYILQFDCEGLKQSWGDYPNFANRNVKIVPEMIDSWSLTQILAWRPPFLACLQVYLLDPMTFPRSLWASVLQMPMSSQARSKEALDESIYKSLLVQLLWFLVKGLFADSS